MVTADICRLLYATEQMSYGYRQALGGTRLRALVLNDHLQRVPSPGPEPKRTDRRR